ncbi:hypothetical protein HS088_TW23G00188 [Tripterygium wilfordii]|uniref:Uncharacterized protein n=1 Tax=Tripterygium wilfordii TaxID=458696 RepID=A0A7J7BV97_TRIWF|nr:hypothetical protein HS088_TW23G00188 [Tripterygium wilfordii]
MEMGFKNNLNDWSCTSCTVPYGPRQRKGKSELLSKEPNSFHGLNWTMRDSKKGSLWGSLLNNDLSTRISVFVNSSDHNYSTSTVYSTEDNISRVSFILKFRLIQSWDPYSKGADPEFLKASLASRGSSIPNEKQSNLIGEEIPRESKQSLEDTGPVSSVIDTSRTEQPINVQKTLKDAVKTKNKRRKGASSTAS